MSRLTRNQCVDIVSTGVQKVYVTMALVTGAAGFIGYHACVPLIAQGYEAFGLETMIDYYDFGLKGACIARLGPTVLHLSQITCADP